jgi:hypothetical protein
MLAILDDTDVEPARTLLSTDESFDFVNGRLITELYLVCKCCAILHLLYLVQMSYLGLRPLLAHGSTRQAFGLEYSIFHQYSIVNIQAWA